MVIAIVREDVHVTTGSPLHQSLLTPRTIDYS